jgi:hypothetical protein
MVGAINVLAVVIHVSIKFDNLFTFSGEEDVDTGRAAMLHINKHTNRGRASN